MSQGITLPAPLLTLNVLSSWSQYFNRVKDFLLEVELMPPLFASILKFRLYRGLYWMMLQLYYIPKDIEFINIHKISRYQLGNVKDMEAPEHHSGLMY